MSTELFAQISSVNLRRVVRRAAAAADVLVVVRALRLARAEGLVVAPLEALPLGPARILAAVAVRVAVVARLSGPNMWDVQQATNKIPDKMPAHDSQHRSATAATLRRPVPSDLYRSKLFDLRPG